MEAAGWYQVKLDGGTATLTLHGEFDLVQSIELAATLEALTEAAERDIELDMADVSFFDSAGLCVILTARHRAHLKGRRLHVCRRSAVCDRLFQWAGLHQSLSGSQPV